MILTGIRPVFFVNLKSDLIGNLKHSSGHPSDMGDPVACGLYGILYNKFVVSVIRNNNSRIRVLSAHGCIKRCKRYYYRSPVTVGEGIRHSLLGGYGRDHRLLCKPVIAVELGGNALIQLLVDRSVRSHIVGNLPGLSGVFLLFLHGGPEALHVHRISLFLKDLGGQIEREAVGIMKLKGIGAVKLCPVVLFHLLTEVIQDRKPLIHGLVELVLLLGKDV